MSREIKFNVWDNKQKIFLEDVPCVEAWIGSDCWDDPEDADPYDWMVAPTHNGRLVWLQYINAKDKDGREIYDGDIVESSSEVRFVIKWYDEEMRWALYSMSTYYPVIGAVYLKVVGNIFENPDLV